MNMVDWMRAADGATYFRTALGIFTVYLVIAKTNPVLIAFLIAATMLLDAVDGYFAVRETSRGSVSFVSYVRASMGNRLALAKVRRFKEKSHKTAAYGPRIDVAGDRVVEYVFWIVFAYLHVIPLFVLILVLIRHSFVDAFMAAKGTSSKMKSRFARAIYSSNLGRGGINVVKFLTFAYLGFVYIWAWPAWIGYILVTVLLSYVMLRGAAEIYESVIA